MTNTSNQINEDTVKQKAREEAGKLYYDIFKHLTTLSTGSILLVITFLEKLFKNPRWRILIAIAFGSFVLSIIMSVMAMFSVAYEIHESGKLDEADDKFTGTVNLLAFGSFLLGIICLIVFALLNLYTM